MQASNSDEYYDVSTRNKKYGRVNAMNGPLLLEKYVLSLMRTAVLHTNGYNEDSRIPYKVRLKTRSLRRFPRNLAIIEQKACHVSRCWPSCLQLPGMKAADGPHNTTAQFQPTEIKLRSHVPLPHQHHPLHRLVFGNDVPDPEVPMNLDPFGSLEISVWQWLILRYEGSARNTCCGVIEG